MIWIQEDDLKKIIKIDILNVVIEEDATILTDAELTAMAEIEGYLSNRYDVSAIWDSVGNDRNNMLVMIATDIMFYHIHSRINPNRIPQLRIDRFNSAIDYLKNVAKSLISPKLPKIVTETGIQTNFKYGSEIKRRY